jgi:glycerol-3-phosphate acyltransferase PlsY
VTAYFIFIPIGYLIGAIPFGLVATWLTKRVDVRDFGSGKTGMTNVMRTAGVKVGVVVLLLDMGKAVLAIALPIIFADTPGADAGAGLAALVGHIWPVYVGFRGGRGIGPGWGGLFMFHPLAGVIATGIGVPLVLVTRYVSLGSLVGAVSGAIVILVFALVGIVPFEYMFYGIIGATLIVYKHRDNIVRLLRGEERKLGVAARPVSGRAKGTETA